MEKKNSFFVRTRLTMEDGEAFAFGMMRAYAKLVLKSTVIAIGILLLLAIIGSILE
jgi:hypothetical protein